LKRLEARLSVHECDELAIENGIGVALPERRDLRT
jgi:hypothetical protein